VSENEDHFYSERSFSISISFLVSWYLFGGSSRGTRGKCPVIFIRILKTTFLY